MIHIVLPLPFDAWSTFEVFIHRFVSTFKEYPPGADYTLHCMCCWGKPVDDVHRIFYGIKTKFHCYYENGCDIGSAQALAPSLQEAEPMLMMTSRCFFHRQGWLACYERAWERFGEGLYGASVSWEGGKVHVCTRAYMMSAGTFSNYPHVIDTREKGQLFEVGEWSITDWVGWKGMHRLQVTWDGEQELYDARKPDEQGIYRRGGQQAMLVWDRHTERYAHATNEEKEKLTAMADPPEGVLSQTMNAT